MRTPEFELIQPDLWQWKDWFIACAFGRFWLLTAAAREFGPFEHFEEAYSQSTHLA